MPKDHRVEAAALATAPEPPVKMPAEKTVRASVAAVGLLMALTALGQLATNIVVPSLHDIAGDVGLPAGSVGLILSMVLLGLALGQLVVGPLSDAVGRKPVLIGGLVVYLLGSIGATVAGQGSLLLLARLVQGLGASAGLALPRAIARDRYAGPEFMRTMALLTMAMSVTPGLAPVLGGVLTDAYGWRVALSSSVLAGAVMLLASLMALRETHLDRTATGGLASVLAGYLHVLRNRSFLVYAVMSGALIGGAYAEVSGAQQFYAGEFGWPSARLSLATASYAAAAFAGTALGGRIPATPRLRIGICLVLLAPATLLLSRLAGIAHPGAMLGLVILSQIGMGMMIGMAIGAALLAVDGAAGTASAVLGAVHMAMGAAGAAIVSMIPAAMGWSIPVTMLGFALLASLMQLATSRIHR